MAGLVTFGRRALAFGLVVASVIVVVGEWAFGWSFCSDVIAQVGNKAVVQRCGPLSASDFLPVAAAVLLLLLPDLDEIGLPGGTSIKMRVDAQETRQNALAADVERIQQSVVQQNHASSTQQVFLMPAPQAALGKFDAKLATFADALRTEAVGSGDASGWADWSADYDAELKSLGELSDWLLPWQFLGQRLDNPAWRVQVNHALASAPSLGGETDVIRDLAGRLTDRDAQIVGRWWELFESDIRVVRAAFAALSRATTPDPEALRSAVELGRKLKSSLESELATAAG